MLDPPAPVTPETAPGIDECRVKIEVPAANTSSVAKPRHKEDGATAGRSCEDLCSRNFQEQFVRASVGFQVG